MKSPAGTYISTNERADYESASSVCSKWVILNNCCLTCPMCFLKIFIFLHLFMFETFIWHFFLVCKFLFFILPGCGFVYFLPNSYFFCHALCYRHFLCYHLHIVIVVLTFHPVSQLVHVWTTVKLWPYYIYLQFFIGWPNSEMNNFRVNELLLQANVCIKGHIFHHILW